VHALGGGHAGCLAITVDERWLCANDGRLTVFKCRDALMRFLGLLRIDHMGRRGLRVTHALRAG
jgi:hypothetical protein